MPETPETAASSTSVITEGALRPVAPPWYKGMPSPNPSGRPKNEVARLRKAIKAVDPNFDDIVANLYRIIRDDGERARDRVMAAQLVLAYAVGRPEVAVKVSAGEGGAMALGLRIDTLPDATLRALADAGVDLREDVVDTTAEEQAGGDER